MNKNVVITCLLSLMIWSVIAQETYTSKKYYKDGYFKIENEKGAKGLVDFDDNIIFSMRFESIQLFDGGIVKLENEAEKYGLVNLNQDTIIPFEYSRLNVFSNGYVLGYKGYKFGYLNTKGEEVLPFDYNYLSECREGKIAYRKGNRCGVMDTSGNILIPPSEFFIIEPFYDGYAKVGITNLNEAITYGVINEKGEEIIEPKYQSLYRFPHAGYGIVYEEKIKSGKGVATKTIRTYGYQNPKKSILIEPEYNSLDAGLNDVLLVSKDDTSYLIDSEQNVLFSAPRHRYNAITYDDRYAKFFDEKAEKYTVVDLEGKVVSDKEYQTIYVYDTYKQTRVDNKLLILDDNFKVVAEFQNGDVLNSDESLLLISTGLDIYVYDTKGNNIVFEKKMANVRHGRIHENTLYLDQKNNWKLYNTKFKEFKPLIYDKMDAFNKDGLALVQSGFSKGVININGEEVLPPIYSDIYSYGEGRIVAKKSYNEPVQVLNYEGDSIFSFPKNTKFNAFSDGMALVSDDYELRYINENGEEVFKSGFQSGDFVGGRAPFQSAENLVGFYDKTGAVAIPAQFNSYGSFSDGVAPVKKSEAGKWGFIDLQGKFIVEPTYDEVSAIVNGFARVRLGDKMGLINTAGKIVIDVEYEDVVILGDNLFGFKQNGLYGIKNAKGKTLSEPKFGKLSEFKDGLGWVLQNNLIQLVNAKGEKQFDQDYAAATLGDGGFSFVRNKEGLYGIVDASGTEILPVEYELITTIVDNTTIMGFTGGWKKVSYK